MAWLSPIVLLSLALRVPQGPNPFYLSHVSMAGVAAFSLSRACRVGGRFPSCDGGCAILVCRHLDRLVTHDLDCAGVGVVVGLLSCARLLSRPESGRRLASAAGRWACLLPMHYCLACRWRWGQALVMCWFLGVYCLLCQSEASWALLCRCALSLKSSV
jgi:hypothetical protein